VSDLADALRNLDDMRKQKNDAARELNDVSEELRRIDIPDHDTRRRIDTCEAVTKTIIKTAKGYLNTETDEDQEIEKQSLDLVS